MLEEPNCLKRGCIHFMGVGGGKEPDQVLICKAFPSGIPEEIAYGANQHLSPVPGDHGIQFQTNREMEKTVDTSSLFDSWRSLGRYRNEFGLAWFLAYQFCKRFYSSHGIVPHIIEKDGLGYYGIQLDYVKCNVNRKYTETLGRMTMAGNVENWQTGQPGDHGLDTSTQCQNGVSSDQLVIQALAHMNLPTLPARSHVNCRHKRWGVSYELVFEIATILTIRNSERIRIWNHPCHTEKIIRELDPKADMPEHPGAFVISNHDFDNRIVIAGDGRLLDGSNRNYWNDYMRGETPFSLATSIERVLFNDLRSLL